MDISSDKQAKYHTRRLGLGKEREILWKKLNISDYSKKQCHKDNVKARIDKTQQKTKKKQM